MAPLGHSTFHTSGSTPARRHGRHQVSCIVLGRGESDRSIKAGAGPAGSQGRVLGQWNSNPPAHDLEP